jgi:hypothetical protein
MLAWALVAAPGFAQKPEQSWESLNRLVVEQRIEIVDRNLKVVKGTFLRFSLDGISLRTETQDLTVKRPDVIRVTLHRPSRRARNIAIGAAAGLAAGLGAGIGLKRSCGEGCWVNYPALAGIGAGLGAGIGAIPGETRETVYRVRK